MAELPGLRAALREHEARMGRLLAQQQETLLLATLERFFGRPPTFGATRHDDPTPEYQPPSPREWLDQDFATERACWSEAIQGLLLQQSQQLRSCVVEEAQKQARAIQALQDCLGAVVRAGADEADEADGEAREVQLAGVPHLNLGALRKQAGLRDVIEQQGVALKDLSGAVARIEAILQRSAGDADELEACSPQPEAPVVDHRPDQTRAQVVPRGPMTTWGHSNSCLEAQVDVKHPREVSGGSSSAPSAFQGELEDPVSLRRQSTIECAVNKTGHCMNFQQVQQYCKKISHDRRFTLICASMIIANGVLLGVETNEAMTTPDLTLADGVGYRVASAFFCLVFLVELAIRSFSDGAKFLSCRNPDFQWNCLDTFLIGITVIEEIMLLFYVETDLMNLGFLRLSRLLKLTRLMRAFKLVRELKELRIMAHGLAHCARPLFWAMVMIGGLTYMTAIVVCVSLTDYRSMQEEVGLDKQVVEFINTHLSNIWECMYTLFECLAGGRDWGDLAEIFRQISWILVCCLVLYILIGVFCLLNLLTAVFLEGAQRLDDVQDLVYEKRDWMMEVERFFQARIPTREADADPAVARISRAMFIKLMDSMVNVKFLEDNGVDLCFAGAAKKGELFDIMDVNGDGYVTVEEFVQWLYNLKGPARALDLMLEMQRTKNMIASFQDGLESSKRSSWRG